MVKVRGFESKRGESLRKSIIYSALLMQQFVQKHTAFQMPVQTSNN
jgi:hypothetical protein